MSTSVTNSLVANVVTTNTTIANQLTSNVVSVSGILGASSFTANTLTANSAVTTSMTANTLTITGSMAATQITTASGLTLAGNLAATGISATGAITAGSLISTGNIAGTNLTLTGNLVAANLSGDGYALSNVQATATASPLTSLTGQSGVVTHDTANGRNVVFYHSNIAGSVTPNFTNVPTAASYGREITLVLEHGNAVYMAADPIQIEGVSTSVFWTTTRNTAPGTISGKTIVTYGFTRTNAGAWVVTGDAASYDEFVPRRLIPSSGAVSDSLGFANAPNGVAISADATRAILGSANYNNYGSAFIYVRVGTAWIQEATLLPSDLVGGDRFGAAVAIDSTGTRVVIGATAKTVGGNSQQGVAYIYKRTGNAWTLEQKINSTVGAVSDSFGNTVSITADGSRLVVGTFNGSAAYVFARSGTTWTQEQKLTPADASKVGWVVSINASDGSRIATCGRLESTTWVFSRSGTTWTQETAAALASGATGTSSNYMAYNIALDSTGTRLAIASPFATIGANATQGGVNVFTRSGTTWTKETLTILSASDGAAGDLLGYGLGLDSTGTRVMAGAYVKNTARGAVYVFVRSGTSWTQEAKLTSSDATGSDCFGITASLDGSGTRALIAASNKTFNGGASNQGAAYIAGRTTGGVWVAY